MTLGTSGLYFCGYGLNRDQVLKSYGQDENALVFENEDEGQVLPQIQTQSGLKKILERIQGEGHQQLMKQV